MATTPTRSANVRHTPKLTKIVDEAVHSDRCHMPTAHPRLYNALLQGADPNERAWDGETALSAACVKSADVQSLMLIATLFLVNGADPGILSSNGSSALSAAVYANSLPLVRLLLEHGGQRVRHAAVAHGLERLLDTAHAGLMAKEVAVYSDVKQFVEHGHIKLAATNRRHRLLCEELSAWFAQQECTEGPLAASVAPSATSGSGDAAAAAAQPKSPLLSPAVLVRLVQKGDVARLKQALELGADPNTADNGKITLLMHAIQYNHPCIVQLLIDTGRCDLARRNLEGQTALLCSIEMNSRNIAQQLISAGCNVNARDYRGMTALVLALNHEHYDLVPVLLAAGADVNAADVIGVSPLLRAAVIGHCASITALLDAGADINCRHCTGITPLIAAVMQNHLQAVQLLLSRGADPNAPNGFGIPPLLLQDVTSGSIRQALLRAGAQAGPSAEELGRKASERAAAIDLTAVRRCVAAALIPESRQRQALKEISEAQRARETALAGSSSSSAAKPSGRSREEADRMAAQLLAEEEAEKAKAQAAQAKKQQKARQRAKAQRGATAARVEGAEAAGQQQEQGQLDSAGSAGAVATPGAVADLVATHAPTSQLAGLTLGSAPAPSAPGPSGTVAPPQQQQQQQQQPPKQQQQQQQQQGASAASQARDDERCCVVCMDRPRSIVLVPCGHVVLCQECCDAVQEKHNECPMCRAVIDVAVALNL